MSRAKKGTADVRNKPLTVRVTESEEAEINKLIPADSNRNVFLRETLLEALKIKK